VFLCCILLLLVDLSQVMWGPSRHLGSLTAANWVSFDFNVSYSSCWGYSLINTLKFPRGFGLKEEDATSVSLGLSLCLPFFFFTSKASSDITVPSSAVAPQHRSGSATPVTTAFSRVNTRAAPTPSNAVHPTRTLLPWCPSPLLSHPALVQGNADDSNVSDKFKHSDYSSFAPLGSFKTSIDITVQGLAVTSAASFWQCHPRHSSLFTCQHAGCPNAFECCASNSHTSSMTSISFASSPGAGQRRWQQCKKQFWVQRLQQLCSSGQLRSALQLCSARQLLLARQQGLARQLCSAQWLCSDWLLPWAIHHSLTT